MQTWNPTLRDYVLVSQDETRIEHYSRQADETWSYQRHTGLDGEVIVASIGGTPNLADVYERVKFGKE